MGVDWVTDSDGMDGSPGAMPGEVPTPNPSNGHPSRAGADSVSATYPAADDHQAHGLM